MKFTLAIAVVATLLPLGLYAQEFRGTISGAVTDPSGTSVAAAKVTVTETHTGTKNERSPIPAANTPLRSCCPAITISRLRCRASRNSSARAST